MPAPRPLPQSPLGAGDVAAFKLGVSQFLVRQKVPPSRCLCTFSRRLATRVVLTELPPGGNVQNTTSAAISLIPPPASGRHLLQSCAPHSALAAFFSPPRCNPVTAFLICGLPPLLPASAAVSYSANFTNSSAAQLAGALASGSSAAGALSRFGPCQSLWQADRHLSQPGRLGHHSPVSPGMKAARDSLRLSAFPPNSACRPPVERLEHGRAVDHGDQRLAADGGSGGALAHGARARFPSAARHGFLAIQKRRTRAIPRHVHGRPALAARR